MRLRPSILTMIAIIDYEAGNLRSVERSLQHLGAPCCITQDREVIQRADRVIFPGVGAAGKAMADIRRLGLDSILQQVYERGMPFLGICLGAQIILERSQEDDARCLGLVPGDVKAFPRPLVNGQGERLKVPHMGWNGVRLVRPHPVLKGIGPEDEFYFVHSYHPMPALQDWILGMTGHGREFPSVIGRGNLIAAQFHPEKSGRPGLGLLENFCTWDGRDVE